MQSRPARVDDAVEIARIHVESWQRTYRGIVPDSYLDSLSIEERAHRWERYLTNMTSSTAVFVAEADDGTVIGFASGGPERSSDSIYTGELYAIYIDAAQHGTGAGRLLARSVANHLHAQGHRTMLVWVLGDNSARNFYQALGGKQVRGQQIEIGGATLEEIAYGWDDLGELIG